MDLQKIFVWVAVGLFASIAVATLSVSLLNTTDIPLATQIQRAEQILIVEPESDVDVPAGTDYRVKVKEVLRGNVRAGSMIRVIQSGDEKQHPSFAAQKSYVFLLKRDPQGPAWLHVDNIFLPIDANTVRYFANGKTASELAMKDFQSLVDKTKPLVEVKARQGWPGGWMLVISENGYDYPMALLDVVQGGDEYDARLVSSSPTMLTATVKSFSISKEGRVDLQFEQAGPGFEFTGQEKDGIVRGEFVAGDFSVSPAWLEPTDLKSLKGFEQPQPSEGTAEYVVARESQKPQAFENFIASHPDNPTLIQAYAFLIATSLAKDPKPEEIKLLAEKYVKTAAAWGPRLEMFAHLKLGGIFARSKLNSLALPEFDIVENSNTIAKLKLDAKTERARFLMLTPGREAEGVALATELTTKQKFMPELTYLLAKQAEKDNRLDDAIALYADIVAPPQFEQAVVESVMGRVPPTQYPRATLAKLWEKKHGKQDGLEEYLSHAYEKALRLDREAIPPRKPGEGNRVALVELFTGATCAPCIAADVATTGLQQLYKPSEVIVLRYHEHIPGPDPLANDETHMRFMLYKGDKTPTGFVNGKKIELGGFMDRAPQTLVELLGEVEPILTEKTGAKIELSAKVQGDIIRVQAAGSDTEEFGLNVRLRLVLAEERVNYPAANGIRVHEMVVRQLPRGPVGIAASGTSVQTEVDIDPAQVRAATLESLTRIESQEGFKFEVKPVDLKSLVIVAMLQEEDTLKILQSAALKLPALKTAENPAP